MTDQPMPGPGKVSVTEPFRRRFVEEGAERDMLGLERYGTALRTHNGRDAGRDAWEEWYDLGKYLEQLRIECADALADVERLTAENGKLASRLAVVERERDEWGGKASTAQAEASAFRHQRDELVRLLDREVMPRYVELYEAAGLGPSPESEAVKAVYAALLPYRELWDANGEQSS